jgi:alkylation response protein AidB-like acyl-CoA dehydrogenase
MDALEHLLRAPAEHVPARDVMTWLVHLDACPFASLVDRALWAGFEADRLGHAFAGGYEAALARLVGGEDVAPGPLPRRSLAATEANGAHPRAIETRLTREGGALALRGTKTFATLASHATELLVVASRGPDPDGRNRLALVRVRADAPGVAIEDRSPTPFAPEIPHARLTLDVTVAPADVFPGDGYDAYLKPFRTIEDLYVLAAALGYVMKSARAFRFDGAVAERAAALALAVRELARRGPSDPVTHLLLAGAFEDARALLVERDAEWEKALPGVRDRWRRDVGLLVIAEAARTARTAAAWRALG